MTADVHALAGAYALDALPPEEAAAFTDHLARCSACQLEVAELQVTAAHLGAAVPQAPPADLRGKVLQAAGRIRQVPPVVAPAEPSRRRRATWPSLVAAAAVALVISVAAAFMLVKVLDDEPAPTPDNPIAAVLEAPDSHASTVTLRGGGAMTVISSHQLDQAVVLSEDLPPLDASKVYQLWLIDSEGDARSADVLIEAAGARSHGTHLVDGLRPGDNIAITRERAGGADQPTMAPLAITRRT